jgi:GT2 family glycosyltransferase
MRVRALIPCYNDGERLDDCLRDLAASRYPLFRVSVVDNGSETRIVAPQLPSSFALEVDRIEPNRGYAGGMNHLLRRALSEKDADLLWLLTPDVRLPADLLGRLVDRLRENPDLGGVSPQICETGTARLWFAGAILQLRKARCMHIVEPRCPGLDTIGDFVTGCTFLVRREVLESVGVFHEPFFMYMEDTDMCVRIRRAGWKLGVDNDATASHHVSKGRSRSAASSDLKHYFIARNRPLFARRHLDHVGDRLYFWAFYLFDIARDCFRDIRGGRRRDARLRLEGLRDALSGTCGPILGARLAQLRRIAGSEDGSDGGSR